MVIVVRNGQGDTSSNPGRDWLHFHIALIPLGKVWIQIFWRCWWCNGYRRRKSTRWHEFKSRPRLIAFHIALIPLGKVWIQLFCRCPWCNGYRRRKWTRRHDFKSWTELIAFHIAPIPLGKVWIQLFSLQLWVNNRADWVLQPWWGN